MSGHGGGKKHQSPSSKISRAFANTVASILLSAMAVVRAIFKTIFGILSALAA